MDNGPPGHTSWHVEQASPVGKNKSWHFSEALDVLACPHDSVHSQGLDPEVHSLRLAREKRLARSHLNQ